VKHVTILAIHNSVKQQISQNKNQTFFVFLYFYQRYGVKQYMIKVSLRLGFMIQFKAKKILLIPTLTFTPYPTKSNVLATSLNLNNKTLMS